MLALDKLYAVSDLHMGGPAGRWAFREGSALGWLIDHIAALGSDEKIGLLLNGDLFDFLAEPGAQEFSFNADSLLRRILGDPQLIPVVQALSRLVSTSGRYLIVQIGNHDIELALAGVQEEFLGAIGAARGEPRARVLFQHEPDGWLCKVAGRLVLAVHGNQSDPWNAVDYKGLQAASGRTRAEGAPKTNAGTTMVLQVINTIKQKYAFVDLLKPEGTPLMAVLRALDVPTSAPGLIKALGRLSVQRGTAAELLGDADAAGSAVEGLHEDVDHYFASLPRPTSEETLLQTEEFLSAGTDPLDLIPDRAGQLGQGVDFIRSRWALRSQPGRTRESLLREALEGWLHDDESFEIGCLSAVDRRILQAATRGVEVVLAGHTHLPRALRYKQCVYLNTGTWMRVLKLQGSRYLQSDAAFNPLWQALQQGSLLALDKLELDPRMRPVAVVDSSGARLYSVREESNKPTELRELYAGGVAS